MLYSVFIKPERYLKVLLDPRFKFSTTEFNVEEVKLALLRRKELPKKHIEDFISALSNLVDVYSKSSYASKLKEARDLIGQRDEKDVPLLALAFAIPNDGIWTGDKDFEVAKKEVKIWQTKDLESL